MYKSSINEPRDEVVVAAYLDCRRSATNNLLDAWRRGASALFNPRVSAIIHTYKF